jgi:hypothetical protein
VSDETRNNADLPFRTHLFNGCAVPNFSTYRTATMQGCPQQQFSIQPPIDTAFWRCIIAFGSYRNATYLLHHNRRAVSWHMDVT